MDEDEESDILSMKSEGEDSEVILCSRCLALKDTGLNGGC